MLPEPIRRARQGAILVFLVAHFALAAVINLVLFAGQMFRPLASATGGVFTGSLVANGVFIVCLAGVIILGVGRLRLYDVGLLTRRIGPALLFLAALWGLAQAVHALAGLGTTGAIRLHPAWLTGSAALLAALLLTQLLGNALFEEIAYRGFLFPQLFIALRGRLENPRRRLLAALLISQGLFALAHVPNRLYLGLNAGELALDLLMLLGWGALFALIYMRTDNLFIAVSVHALGNAPTTLFATAPLLEGAGASLLIYGLAVLLVFGPAALRALGRACLPDAPLAAALE